MTRLISANDFIKQGSGVITLCGSTKFFNECMEVNRLLTFQGWIVLMCGSWGHSFHKFVESKNTNYELVKKLHFQKILISQAIVVVYDDSQYIGDSTKAEISFALTRGIPVFYSDGRNFFGESNHRRPVDELADTSLIDNFAKNNSLGF